MRASLSLVLFALTMGCRKTTAGVGDAELLEARQAAALAWVNALGAGDGATLIRTTADAFTFRSVGADRTCEGRISGGRALEDWSACARARPDLRQLVEAWRLHEASRQSPSAPGSAALERYLPRVVGGDEAWSRFVGADERRHADGPLAALTKEAGNDGAWITISATWLYTTLVLRAQVVGAPTAPRVHAMLVDVTRTTE
jgi:hypothetical protein